MVRGDPRRGHAGFAGVTGRTLGCIAQLLRCRDARQDRHRLQDGVERVLGCLVPRELLVLRGLHAGVACVGRLDLVELGAEREDVEERVEQRVADLLQDVGGAGVAHERRAGVPADRRSREGSRHVDGLRANLREVHALVVGAEDEERRVLLDLLADRVVVGLTARNARDGEVAGQAELAFEEGLHALRVRVVGDDAEARRPEEVLGDRTPQIPHRLERGVLLALE